MTRHTKASIAKMIATRRRNKAIKLEAQRDAGAVIEIPLDAVGGDRPPSGGKGTKGKYKLRQRLTPDQINKRLDIALQIVTFLNKIDAS